MALKKMLMMTFLLSLSYFFVASSNDPKQNLLSLDKQQLITQVLTKFFIDHAIDQAVSAGSAKFYQNKSMIRVSGGAAKFLATSKVNGIIDIFTAVSLPILDSCIDQITYSDGLDDTSKDNLLSPLKNAESLLLNRWQFQQARLLIKLPTVVVSEIITPLAVEAVKKDLDERLGEPYYSQAVSYFMIACTKYCAGRLIRGLSTRSYGLNRSQLDQVASVIDAGVERDIFNAGYHYFWPKKIVKK